MATPSLAGEDVDFLSLLSDAGRQRVLERATATEYPAGTLAYHPGDPPRAFLLDRGLVRVYRSVADGRQATVAFIHSRELVGGTAIVSEVPWVFAQVVVESSLMALDLEVVRGLAARDLEIVRAIAVHLAAQVRNAFRLIAVRSLGDIRDRVAYDLLERACRSQLETGRLEVRVTHAELADSIGSSREVVSRALKGFRDTRIVETAPGLIRVMEPVRLAGMVRAFVI